MASADKVFVAGSDADLVNIQYIAHGKEAAKIWKKIAPLAVTAAETAMTLAQNPDKDPKTLLKVYWYAPVATYFPAPDAIARLMSAWVLAE